jgi:hypothetical protein
MGLKVREESGPTGSVKEEVCTEVESRTTLFIPSMCKLILF